MDIISSSEEMTKLFRAKKVLDANNAELKGGLKTLNELVAETKDKIHQTDLEVKALPSKVNTFSIKAAT